MKIMRRTGTSLSDIQGIIMQHIKEREKSMNSTALAYRPLKLESSSTKLQASKENKQVVNAIKACEESVKKLTLISDFSKVVDIKIIEKLITENRFDKMTTTQILDELIAASSNT